MFESFGTSYLIVEEFDMVNDTLMSNKKVVRMTHVKLKKPMKTPSFSHEEKTF